MKQAKPFIKWAGGKKQLLPQFENFYPKELHSGCLKYYAEPFLGGGALFFAIVQKYKIENIYLSDINKDLILTYQVVQKKIQQLIEQLQQYQLKYNQTLQENRNDLYLKIRENYNLERLNIDYNQLEDKAIKRAADFIFLNKTCFNGLFRLNKKGEFNVPYGKYKTAIICDAVNLLAASQALKNANIVHAHYSNCWSEINQNSFVYFDPPYRPISSTSSFTTYTGVEFNDNEQIKLAQFFKKLDIEKGAKLMLSNSDPTNQNINDDFFQKAYLGYNISRVSANRAINSNGEKRGKIYELLITNYQYEQPSLGFNF